MRLAGILLAILVTVAGCDGGGGVDAAVEGDVGIDSGPVVVCVTDEDCADGRFCNGAERCDATLISSDERGCAPSEVRDICVPGLQECDEAEDRASPSAS